MNISHCGMPRTGTTVVFTICGDLAVHLNSHRINGHASHSFVGRKWFAKVFTVRDPVHQVSSMLSVPDFPSIMYRKVAVHPAQGTGREVPLTEETVLGDIAYYYEHFLANRTFNDGKEIIIKYEDWLPDRMQELIEYLAKELYGRDIDAATARGLASKYSVSNQKAILAKHNLVSFHQQEQAHQLHGGHITSDGMGRTLISKRTCERLREVLHDYCEEFGYAEAVS